MSDSMEKPFNFPEVQNYIECHHVITFSRSVMEDEIYDAIYEVDKATYDLIKDICSQNDTSKTAQNQ